MRDFGFLATVMIATGAAGDISRVLQCLSSLLEGFEPLRFFINWLEADHKNPKSKSQTPGSTKTMWHPSRGSCKKHSERATWQRVLQGFTVCGLVASTDCYDDVRVCFRCLLQGGALEGTASCFSISLLVPYC